MKRKISLICIVLLLAGILFPGNTNAATKKMTVYDYIIKDGQILYCSGYGGIYRADLKRKKLKWIVKKGNPDNSVFWHMKKKASYLYYIGDNKLYRVHVLSGKTKKLAGSNSLHVDEYVISGSKIYYYQEDQKYDRGNRLNRSGTFEMGLNGKGKKKSNNRTEVINKDTNTNNKYRLFWRVRRISKNKWRDDEYVKKSGKKLFHIKRIFYWTPSKDTIFL